MKKLLLFIFTLPFSAHSQSVNIEKVHLNTAAYLRKQLNDPGSYKPVSWGKLEKVYMDDSKLDTLTSQIANVKDFHRKFLNFKLKRETESTSAELEKDTIYQKSVAYIKQDDSLLNKLYKERLTYVKQHKPQLDHYYLEHTFRAKNAYNALRLATYTFFLDKNLRITSYDTQSVASQANEEAKERDKILDDIKKLKEKY